VEIELSVTFAPGLGEAVRAAAAEAGLSLSDWLAQAAEAKMRADGLARVLRGVDVEPITRECGSRAGELLGATRMQDAVDASVALLAGPGDRVLTSDAGDLRALCAGAGNKAVVIDC
jgi:hypothetical protein